MSTSNNKQPILFLDIDGPLVTKESGSKEQSQPDSAVFNFSAVQFVNELVRISGAKIVVISDWAMECMTHDGQCNSSSVPECLVRAFGRNRLVNDQFHRVWSHLCLIGHSDVNKHEITGKHAYMRGYRPAYWLKTQGAHSHYAILDDAVCFHEDILFRHREMSLEPPMDPGYVHINPKFGITCREFDRALELLTKGVRAVGS